MKGFYNTHNHLDKIVLDVRNRERVCLSEVIMEATLLISAGKCDFKRWSAVYLFIYVLTYSFRFFQLSLQ